MPGITRIDPISLYLRGYIAEELTSVSENVEQLWVKIEKPNTRKQLIANIYRPPSGKLTGAIAELTKSMKKAQDSFTSEITLFCDFNVNYNLRHTLPYKQQKNVLKEISTLPN